MKSRRLFQWLCWMLLLVLASAGLALAQDQSYPAPDASNNADVQANGNAPEAAPADNFPEPGAPSNAPDSGATQERQDPPGRVARVQYMSGEVSMQPGGVNDWIAASTNRPLTTSDRIWTDKNSRAELNVGDGFLRMNSETSVTLSNVSDNTVQIELDQGTLAVTVKHLEHGEIYEIDTPNYAFTVMKPGVYRFDVYPNEDQSWVTVRSGYGEATGKGSAVRVNSGEQMRFRGGNSLQHTAEAAPDRDGFDDWARVRDQRLDSSLSARYVSPGVIGYQDLDNYGTWQNAPTYGNIWVPSGVPAGWAPYRYGHWAWIAPWGWTWVDDAPWGFAPFHYGRWVYWNNAWGWAPGPLGYWNPYYAPALVGWIGGPGFGVGFGFGGGFGFGIGINFGWFPLGWGAPYYPRYCGWGHGGWYRGGGYVSNGYFRNVNVTNTRITNIGSITNNYYSNNINARYGNRTIPGAVTAAPRSAFTSGAAINKVGVAVPKGELGKGQMLSTANVTPTRASVLGGQAARTRGVPPASAFNRNVMTHSTPPARPASLQAANQATMARANGAPSTNRGLGASSPNNTAANRGTTPGAVTANRNVGPNTVPASHNGTTANNVPRPPSAGAVNSVSANHNGTANNVSRSPSAGGANTGAANTASARNATPANNASHNVPRPPSAGGAEIAHNGGLSSPATHTVPRPPSSNDSFARGTANSVNTHPYSGVSSGNTGVNNPSSANARSSSSAANSGYRGSTAGNSVPRPPQGYQYGHSTTSAPQASPSYHVPSNSASPSYHAPSSSAPSHSNGSAGSASHPTGSAYYGGSNIVGTNSRAAASRVSVPRPPSSYTYRAAPSYTASTSYGSQRSAYGSGSYGNSRSSYPSASSGYGASRGSYPSASSNYGGRSSYPSAGYSSYGRSSAPSYSARSTPYSGGRSSSPRYGGGSRSASSYHASGGGGGGSYHGGGGGHPSGGGGGHGSGGHR